jgi:cyclopropane fatty-acyl-phospholipid synthase-like methyltransferase
VNINDSFFNGLYKEVWRKTIPAGLTPVEVEFILREGLLQPGCKVLDLMCGYGRHSLELSRNGCIVTAVDNQEEYIKEIIEAVNADGLSVSAVRQDIVEYETDQVFDTIICMGNSFSFFDKEQTETIIQKIGKWLKPGGSFILNSWMVAEIAIRHFREKDWYYVDNYKYLLDYNYRFNPGRIESEQTIVAPDGTIEVNMAVDYIYSFDDLNQMFMKQGLVIEALYSTPRKKIFTLGDGQVYIVARKLRS